MRRRETLLPLGEGGRPKAGRMRARGAALAGNGANAIVARFAQNPHPAALRAAIFSRREKGSLRFAPFAPTDEVVE